MNFKFFLPLALTAGLLACSDDSKPSKVEEVVDNGDETTSAVAVDYSAGRAMNKRLGKGINFGNSWDADSRYHDDCGWNNCILDEHFKIVADAGFNSIRLPVRWQNDADYNTGLVNDEKLAGVKEDIQLAIDNGLAVIVDFHHYIELFEAGNAFKKGEAGGEEAFKKEKAQLVSMWAHVAKELDSFPDSLLVFDVMNEPTISDAELVNELTMAAYEVIRANAKNKTIMFEAYHAAKFADLEVLKLPADGNIIFSGHYYEPYTYTHSGHNYPCKGDDTYAMTAPNDFKSYVALAKKLYPDKNGGHIPMNVGEFGVSGANGGTCYGDGPSDKYKAIWAKNVIKAAESYDMSWHYWGFVGVGGFEAYDRGTNMWNPSFPESLIF